MSNIEKLLEEATSALTACDDIRALDDLRVQYLGKKGLFTEQLKSLGKLSAEERPQAGQAINAAKKQFQQLLESRKAELEGAAIEAKLAAETVEEAAPRVGWGFASVPGSATRGESYRDWSRAAADHFYRTARERLWTCRTPKAVSTSGESEAEFRARLAALAREARDAEVEGLRKRYAPKLARLDQRIRQAEERVERESAQYEHQRTQTVISVGTSVLGALFGRKLGSASNVGRAGTAARAASRATRERGDIARARERVEEERSKLAELDAELEAALADLKTPIDPRDFELEPLEVTPRKSDVSVERLVLAWVPA